MNRGYGHESIYIVTFSFMENTGKMNLFDNYNYGGQFNIVSEDSEPAVLQVRRTKITIRNSCKSSSEPFNTNYYF